MGSPKMFLFFFSCQNCLLLSLLRVLFLPFFFWDIQYHLAVSPLIVLFCFARVPFFFVEFRHIVSFNLLHQFYFPFTLIHISNKSFLSSTTHWVPAFPLVLSAVSQILLVILPLSILIRCSANLALFSLIYSDIVLIFRSS